MRIFFSGCKLGNAYRPPCPHRTEVLWERATLPSEQDNMYFLNSFFSITANLLFLLI
jgi:hypothetical protein